MRSRFHRDGYESLVAGLSPAHALFDATYIGLVNFDGTLERGAPWPNHCSPYLVQPGPSGFIAEAELPRQVHGVASGLGTRRQKHGLEPQPQRFPRTLKYRAGGQGDLSVALRAFDERPLAQAPTLLARARRAPEARGPPQFHQERLAVLFASKAVVKFDSALGQVRDLHPLTLPPKSDTTPGGYRSQGDSPVESDMTILKLKFAAAELYRPLSRSLEPFLRRLFSNLDGTRTVAAICTDLTSISGGALSEGDIVAALLLLSDAKVIDLTVPQ
jgi:hypothetical protein